MQLIPFKSPLWCFNLGTVQDETINKCYALEKQIPTTNNSNRGGYQSPAISLEEMFPELYRDVCLLKSTIEYESLFRIKLANAWVNINRKHDYNITHNHPKAAFSGVIYLKVPDNSGPIVFKNPAPVNLFPVSSESPLFYPDYLLVPNPGDTIFFPAYLHHFVEVNQSNEDRISIAFNMEMV